ATATRLSAARREQRLATLRLVGATPLQVRRLAAVEALVATVPGIVAGGLLFFALRQVAALVNADGANFFATDLSPVPIQAAALLAAVLLVAALASQLTLRRLVISPLGVSRRRVGRPPRPIRAVPLAVSLPLFAFVLARVGTSGSNAAAAAILGGFLLVVVGLVLAGTWITTWVGILLARIGSGTSLLAGRRLRADARSGFRAVAAVVLAVFAATFFHTLTPALAVTVDAPSDDGSTFHVFGHGIDVDDLRRLDTDLGAIDGVEAALPRHVASFTQGNARGWDGWVVPCPSVARMYPEAGLRCGADILVPSDQPVPSERPLTMETEGELVEQADGGVIAEPIRTPLLPGTVATFDARAAAEAGMTTAAGWSSPLPVIVDPSLLPADAPTPSMFHLTVRTDGSPHSLERARTVWINAGLPGQTDEEWVLAAQAEVAEVGHLINLALLATLLIAGCSAAVAVSASVLERRWPFALLRLAGTRLRTLRWVVLLEALAPLMVAALVSLAAGATVAQLVLRRVVDSGLLIVDETDIGVPADVAFPLVIGLAIAVTLVTATLPLLGKVTSTESTRFE
ncbi:MAG: ABC transporter permease, partial [Acidimicrobiales bacterium]